MTTWLETRKKGLVISEEKGVTHVGHEGTAIRLSSLADDLGVDRVELKKMSFDALCVGRADGRFTVFLNEAHPRNRQRFSFAHEASHIVLGRFLGEKANHRRDSHLGDNKRSYEIEGLCNSMASSILLPQQFLTPLLMESDWSAAIIPALSERFKVSFEVAARRYIDLSPTAKVMIVWRPGEEGNRRVQRSLGSHLIGQCKADFSRSPPPQASSAWLKPFFVETADSVDLWQGGSLSSYTHFDNVKVESIAWNSEPYRQIYSFIHL